MKSRAKGVLAAKLAYRRGTGGGPPLETEDDLRGLRLNEVYINCIIACGMRTSVVGNSGVPDPLQAPIFSFFLFIVSKTTP